MIVLGKTWKRSCMARRRRGRSCNARPFGGSLALSVQLSAFGGALACSSKLSGKGGQAVESPFSGFDAWKRYGVVGLTSEPALIINFEAMAAHERVGGGG